MPGKLDLDLYRGDTFRAVIAISDKAGAPAVLPADGWRAHVRHPTTGVLLAEATIDATDGPSGVLVLTIPASTTQTMNGAAVYDLEHRAADVTTTWIAGTIRIRGDVTHD